MKSISLIDFDKNKLKTVNINGFNLKMICHLKAISTTLLLNGL
jgi:hypothetical protein